jgi:Ca2+-binding EF-hand superfamily protein
MFRRLFARRTQLVSSRGFSGGGGANSDSFYGRLMGKYPVATSVATAMALWGGGDLASQGLEMHEDKEAKFQSHRFMGVLSHGCLIGGLGNYAWYSWLDSFVRSGLGLTSGARFVAAKIGLEVALWHPTSLLCFWLRQSYWPTLAGDVCLWTPMDILNFSRVPVHLQTTFINMGSLFEAVVLSYIHKHGFGGESVDDKIEEKKSRVAALNPATIFSKLIHLESNLSHEELRSNIKMQFARLDVDHTGFLSIDELTSGAFLPGIDDSEVNAKVAEMLHRLADGDGDGRVSEAEYSRFLLKFHAVVYRKKFIAEVVLALFDENDDGFIDSKEMKKILRVFGCDSSDEAVKEAMRICDINGDGKVSSQELADALRTFSRPDSSK